MFDVRCHSHYIGHMQHEQIDQRSLAMARAIAEAIDNDPAQSGLRHARATCARWLQDYGPDRNVQEWEVILAQPWPEVRRVLLEDTEEGRRHRQNSPFAGVLPPRERWDIYRKFRDDPQPA